MHEELGVNSATVSTETAIPPYQQVLGHPRPLWMLFMTEFWERFCYYGMRWALVLYIVAQFHHNDPAAQTQASQLYGIYSGLIYAGCIFGGFIADHILGYQRSILLGAFILAIGQFFVAIPTPTCFELGLAISVVGSGFFKPNVSTIVGKIYHRADPRRDRGFTLFYMGINAGSFVSPVLTGWLAQSVFGTPTDQNYQVVFIVSGIGMLISLVWFLLGKKQFLGVGGPPVGRQSLRYPLTVFACAVGATPLVFWLLRHLQANVLTVILAAMLVCLSAYMLLMAARQGRIAVDRVLAMLTIFLFNIVFWIFFEQAGSSFTFLAENIVDRHINPSWQIPLAWYQAVNPIAILIFAPLVAACWTFLYRRRREPSVPAKFAYGLLFNSVAFLPLIFALIYLMDPHQHIPYWPLVVVYVLQTVGELCLSPIGLSMVSKLAPSRLTGIAMGGWFLSISISSKLAGVFAGSISGETGMTVHSALAGYQFGFWSLFVSAIILLLITPKMKTLMHGVK